MLHYLKGGFIMDRKEYKTQMSEIAKRADDAAEVYEEVAKAAKTQLVQTALTERKARITYRLQEELEELDNEFGIGEKEPDGVTGVQGAVGS